MSGRRHGRHRQAWIEGDACPLDEAIRAAARRLRMGRQAVFAGLGCDIAGTRAVVRLAARIGAAIDHLGGSGYADELDVLRDSGAFLTTPGEARARADTLLVVAPQAFAPDPELLDRVCATSPALSGSIEPRCIIWLGGKGGPRQSWGSAKILPVAASPSQIAPILAALGARLAGRPIGSASLPVPRLDAILDGLRHARFGVAHWPSGALDRIAIERLAGLVRALNQKTRFSCLPTPPADNAAGVAMAMTWLTGFPSNIGFGRGEVEHDPWRFDSTRLVLSGEADLALWISAYRGLWPDWAGSVPLIALTSRGGSKDKRRGLIEIEVGSPGVDHDCIDLSPATGSLAFRAATAPSALPSVAQVVSSIDAVLGDARRMRT